MLSVLSETDAIGTSAASEGTICVETGVLEVLLEVGWQVETGRAVATGVAVSTAVLVPTARVCPCEATGLEIAT